QSNTRPGALDRALTIPYRIHARRNCHMGSRVGWLRDRRAGSCNVARRTLGLARWVALSPSIIGFRPEATATCVHVVVGFGTVALAAATLLEDGGPKRGGIRGVFGE